MLFLISVVAVVLANAGFGPGMMPWGAPNHHKAFADLIAADPQGASKQARANAIFSDGMDGKPLGQMIAAGFLPRYQPMTTDGHDSSEMWLAGLGQFGPMTEEQVVAKAKSMYPMSAQLGHPQNEELAPVWNQVMAAQLTRGLNEPANSGHGKMWGAGFGAGMGGGAGVPGGFHPEYEHPEYEHPEYEHPEFGENGFGFGYHGGASGATTGTDTTGTGSTNTNNMAANIAYMMSEGFGEGVGEGGAAENSEDMCPRFTEQQCKAHQPHCYWMTLPGQNNQGFCMVGASMLRKAHQAPSESPKGVQITAVEVLYCLWGLTTGLLVGVCYMLRTQKRSSLADPLTA